VPAGSVVKGQVFERRTKIAATAEEVFLWHTQPETLEKLIPPWERVRVVQRVGQIGNGARVVFLIRLGPLRMRWVSVHRDYRAGRQFVDVQESGPFKRWEHLHLVEPDGPASCRLIDRIEYALPFGSLGEALAGVRVRRRLERLFEYRHQVTAQQFARSR